MMLGSLAMFALGSALCGAAQNINWLIAARSTLLAHILAAFLQCSITYSDTGCRRRRAVVSH